MAFLADRRCDDLSFRGRGGGGPADTPARVEAARHGKTLGRTWEGGDTPTGVHLRTKRFWIIRPQVCARDYQGSCGELRHPAFLFCGTNRCEVPPPTVGDAAMYHPRTNLFLTAVCQLRVVLWARCGRAFGFVRGELLGCQEGNTHTCGPPRQTHRSLTFRDCPTSTRQSQPGGRSIGHEQLRPTHTSQGMGTNFYKLPHIKKPIPPVHPCVGHERSARRTRLRVSQGFFWRKSLSGPFTLVSDTSALPDGHVAGCGD